VGWSGRVSPSSNGFSILYVCAFVSVCIFRLYTRVIHSFYTPRLRPDRWFILDELFFFWYKTWKTGSPALKQKRGSHIDVTT